MKIREGFVSNSSSSSFIIGVAKLNDPKAFAEWLLQKKVSEYEVKIVNTRQLVNGEDIPWDIKFKNNRLSVESFEGSEVSIPVDPNKAEFFVTISIANGEGDCGGPFYSNEYDSYDPCYEKVHEDGFFTGYQAELLGLGNLPGVDFESSSIQIGAGRDG